MKDEELQNLFGTIESEVAASDRLRNAIATKLAARKSQRRPWKMAAGLATACVIAGAFFLLPKPAEGAKLKDMINALKDVKSMQATTYVYRPTGRRRATVTTYAGGIWRLQTFIGTPFERTLLVSNQIMWRYDPTQNVALMELLDNTGTVGDITALEYVREFTDIGAGGPWDNFKSNGERATHTKPGPVWNGRQTYKILFDRPDQNYHAEILVDMESNLPICDAIRTEDQSIDDEYIFNAPIPASLLDPNFGAGCRTIDVVAASKELAERWALPIGSVSSRVGKTNVRDIQVNQTGTVFIVSSAQSPRNEQRLVPETLSDENDVKYLKVRDYRPGNTFICWVADHFKVDGEWPVITVFTPTEPGKPGHRFKVGFGVGLGDGLERGSKSAEHPMGLDLTAPPACEGGFPEYATLLRLNEAYGSIVAQELDTRARYYEERGDNANAARWYHQTAMLEAGLKRSNQHYYLSKEADCDKRLGRLTEAAALQTEIDRLKAIDPNIHKNLNMPIRF